MTKLSEIVVGTTQLLILLKFFIRLLASISKFGEKCSGYCCLLIVILMPLISLEVFITLIIINVYFSCLCQSFIYRFLQRRYID